MRPLRRKRRPDDGRYLPKDRAVWKRLVRWARSAARDPRRYGPELAAAATAAARAVPPPGYATRESVFLQLLTRGRVFSTTLAEKRAALAAELEALAARCAEILDAPAAEPRRRADLE